MIEFVGYYKYKQHCVQTLLEQVLFNEIIISLKVLFSKFKKETFEMRELKT